MSVTYAGNSADAHLQAAASLLGPDPAGVAGEAFFITNDTPVPFWDFGRAIQRAAGITATPDQIKVVNPAVAYCIAWVLEWVAWFTGSKPMLARAMVKYLTMNRWYNISKAKERLGYRPNVDWEEGVRRGVKASFPAANPGLTSVLLTHSFYSGTWRSRPRPLPNKCLCACFAAPYSQKRRHRAAGPPIHLHM